MTIFDEKKLEIELKLSVNNLMEWNVADSESKSSDSELSVSSQHNGAIELSLGSQHNTCTMERCNDDTAPYVLYNPYATYSIPTSPTHLSVLVTDSEETSTKCAILDSNHRDDIVDSNVIEIQSRTSPAK